jgi:hypothetical protein
MIASLTVRFMRSACPLPGMMALASDGSVGTAPKQVPGDCCRFRLALSSLCSSGRTILLHAARCPHNPGVMII